MKNQSLKNIIIYKSKEGPKLEVRLEEDTVWLTQKQMAVLFDKDSDTIGLHLKNIYSEGELEEEATTEFLSVVRMEGSRKVKRTIKFYNLDAIISVGYRVNSKIEADQKVIDSLREMVKTYEGKIKRVIDKVWGI